MTALRHDASTVNDNDIAEAVMYRLHAECADDVIGVHDADTDGTIAYLSPNVLELTGYSARELAGRTLVSCADERDRDALRRFIAQLRHEARPQAIAWRIACRDGAPRWAVTLARAAYDPMTGAFDEIVTSTHASSTPFTALSAIVPRR